MPTTVGRWADAVANALLNLEWRAVALTALPTTTYWALSTTQPTNTGSSVTEPTDPGYARIAVTRSTGNFNAAAARSVSNAVDITWPAADAGGSGYGDIGWIPVYDALSGGTYLGYWVVTGGPTTIGAGVAPTFPPNSLTWVSAGS